MTTKAKSGQPASAHDTVDAIASSAGRVFIPIRKSFIQKKVGGRSAPGPLAKFVTAGDRTGLLLYLLALTKASTAPWDVALHSAVWARALGVPEPTSKTARSRISKAWTRIVDRQLVDRGRKNRLAKLTLLREDGSGEGYSRPSSDFFKVPHSLWIDGPSKSERWYEVLSLAELALLLIALNNADDFPLPAERGPTYYGISADTVVRGTHGLRRHGILDWRRKRITAPLAPEGFSFENRYTLKPPFGPVGRKSTASSRAV
jgi:hypothetical protein